MEIKLTIPKKILKAAADEIYISSIFDEYDEGVIERAGIKSDDVIQAIMDDETFQSQMPKLIAKEIMYSINDAVISATWDLKPPKVIKETIKACEIAYKQIVKEEEEEYDKQSKEQQQARIDSLIAELDVLGYNVSKKGEKTK